MNFYDPVNENNALEWYAELPAHIKKPLDEKRSKFKSGRECSRRELPALYETVEKELGSRPLRPADPADSLDGHTQKQIEQFERHKKWGARYDELLLISLIMESALAIQTERKLLNEAMGLNVNAGDLPNQADGLDPTTSATVRWLQASGEMPLEFLARTYRDDEARTGDRITAARTLMDYVHRKVPQKTETEVKDITEPKLDRTLLKKLNEKELNTLEELLLKLK